MKTLFELGNHYAKSSTWKDFALVKFCLCAMGILIGMQVKPKHRKIVGLAAVSIFALSYVPLMSKVFHIGKEMIEEKKQG